MLFFEGHATWNAYLVNGNDTHIAAILPLLAAAYRDRYIDKYSAVADGKPCWKQEDGADAMEVSISGSGCRPTIASALYGDAVAIVNMAALVGNASLQAEFEHWANFSANIILEQHWNDKIDSFATIPLSSSSSPFSLPATVRVDAPACNLTQVRPVNTTVDVRELLGFMPWYFSGLIPNASFQKYILQWKSLFDAQGLSGPWGLRTAELRSTCYNYSWTHGDCWNGPSWPYETARVLTAAANVLNDYPPQSVLSAKDYYALVLAYAKQHTRTFATNDTASPSHSGHVFENLHADLGYWNNRGQMYWRGDANKNQGNNCTVATCCIVRLLLLHCTVATCCVPCFIRVPGLCAALFPSAGLCAALFPSVGF